MGENCIHSWVLVDVNSLEYYNGFDVDFTEEYTLVCRECKEKKKVDELGYLTMKKHGLINERQAIT